MEDDSDCLATAVERALAFSGAPVLLLVDPVVIGVTRVDLPGLTESVALQIRAAIRAGGRRFRGRVALNATRDDVLTGLDAGRPFILIATGSVFESRVGQVILGFANFTDDADERKLQELERLTSARYGAGLYAEIMN
ncbi:hypothetical protein [Methylopila sp. Yamaguchi]|uniref:hypothetical protein n=1 Tax=Methylopila sp. Yamaguchi TaxID=1437817 RepID=UPI000CB84FF3|nr:hypothetical protein [Methylopila sp. Yamaguchi]GBD50252.1 hypothetical protein METY_3465 [Methylopila sp. Yamaguchi]